MPITPAGATPQPPIPPPNVPVHPAFPNPAAYIALLQSQLAVDTESLRSAVDTVAQLQNNLMPAINALISPQRSDGTPAANAANLVTALNTIRQLNQGLDPTTGKPLPEAVETSLGPSISDLYGAVKGSLKQMASFADPNNPDGARNVASAGQALVAVLEGSQKAPNSATIQGYLKAAGTEAAAPLSALNLVASDQCSKLNYIEQTVNAQTSSYANKCGSLEQAINNIEQYYHGGIQVIDPVDFQ